MDWLERMNAAINYIEVNLTGDIDYKQVAQIACCPNYHFQRMFSFIAEISLSEYIRRRRLTNAAFELQQSNLSVLEIAQKYGYDSHSAFTRAFSEMHSIAPIFARKSGAKLKAFPRISFDISIIGGKELDYRIEQIGAFSAVGIKYRINTIKAQSTIPSIFSEIAGNGLANRLFELSESSKSKVIDGILGICADGDWGRNEEFNYYISVQTDREVTDGMENIEFPESQWVVFEAPTIIDIIKSWRMLYSDWIPTSGYSLANLPAIECYYPPEHKPQNELWIPIIKN